MRKSLVALACMIVVGTLGLSSPAWAQPKTVRICQDEWRADKAANQAKGITEKAYIAQCRSSGPRAAPAAPPAKTAASPPAAMGQKTVKACQEEWRANKTTNQANGTTEKAYVAQCRAGATVEQSSLPTPAAQTPTAAPPAPSPSKPAPAPTASAAPAGLNQFATEAGARGHCPPDTVVWVNLRSKIYHYAGHKTYGNTKDGAYMCERDTTAQGMRASKNEKRPG